MNFWRNFLILILFFFSLNGKSMKTEADLILLDGLFPDWENKKTITLSLAIKQDRILFAGSRREALKFKGSQTRIISVKGKTILPGLHDAHVHFEEGARSIAHQMSVRYLNLEQIRQKIRQAVEVSPPGALIEAYHFHQTYFKDERWPTKYDLDDIAPRNPVIVYRVDGHSAWVNSRALELAGIGRETPDPAGGKIERFEDGLPNGILKEKATDLLKSIKAPLMVNPDAPAYEDEIVYAMKYANSLGITSVTTSADFNFLKRLQQLAEKNQLTLRFNLWLNYQEYSALGRLVKKLNSPFLRFELIKFFADGTLGSQTAYLFHPFKGSANNYGLLIQPLDQLAEQIENAVSNGYSVLVHSIGDRATHEVLKIFHRIRKKGFQSNLLRIEHVQFLQDNDLKEFADNNVIASMQPTHCTTDLLIAEDYLQSETWRKGYRWQSLLKNRAILAFGTDWPVEPLDPRRGIYSALTRKNIEQQIPASGWLPEESIDYFEIVRAYTSAAALAANDLCSGLIMQGKLADVVVFDGDLESLAVKNPEEILTVPVFMTICNGKIVYQNR